eukprot:4015296-Pleurochrysis_carterae.AAC.1
MARAGCGGAVVGTRRGRRPKATAPAEEVSKASRNQETASTGGGFTSLRLLWRLRVLGVKDPEQHERWRWSERDSARE